MDTNVQSVTNILGLAQIELANLNPEDQMQGLLLPEQLANPESLFPGFTKPAGFLMAEGKYYGFRQEEAPPVAEKLQQIIREANKPKELKSTDPKESTKELKFTKEHARIKELKTQKTDLPETQTGRREVKEGKTESKTSSIFEKTRPQENVVPKPINLPQTQPHRQFAERPVQQGRSQGDQETEEKKETRSKDESKHRFSDKDEKSIRENANQQIERQQEKEKEKEKEKERQGFAEDQKKQDQEKEDEKKGPLGVEKVTFEQEFVHYAKQESYISELVHMRVSQFDVILLFLEIMKLAIKSREEERIARWQERELRLYHLQKVCDNFKQQAKYQLFAGIGSGIFEIISGMCPIIRHLGGEWIQDKLSYLIKSLKDMDTDKLFKSLARMTHAGAELQKSTGQIQNTFAESSRTFDQQMMEMRKSDADENTRTMDDIKDHWKNIENFIHQILQMFHDAIRQLYNN